MINFPEASRNGLGDQLSLRVKGLQRATALNVLRLFSLVQCVQNGQSAL